MTPICPNEVPPRLPSDGWEVRFNICGSETVLSILSLVSNYFFYSKPPGCFKSSEFLWPQILNKARTNSNLLVWEHSKLLVRQIPILLFSRRIACLLYIQFPSTFAVHLVLLQVRAECTQERVQRVLPQTQQLVRGLLIIAALCR